MKTLLYTATAVALMAGSASADTVKVGLLLGFTGPLESIAPLQGNDGGVSRHHEITTIRNAAARLVSRNAIVPGNGRMKRNTTNGDS